MSDSYGEGFGRRLGANAKAYVARALPRSPIAVTELRYSSPTMGLSTPPATENAYVVAVHFELFENYAYWENGRAAPKSVIRPGENIIYDLRRAPTFHLSSGFHSVHFYFPALALRMLAEQAGAPSIQELHYKPAVAHDDRLLAGIASGLLPLFESEQPPHTLLLDHLMMTVGFHVATKYGGLKLAAPAPLGGLSRRQEHLAKEMIMSGLDGTVSLGEVADRCGLSPSYFSKAFRRTTGMSPYRWMARQRIETAKQLLRENSEMAISEVALQCGFADQSHFTHAFTAAVGSSPRAWRRAIDS